MTRDSVTLYLKHGPVTLNVGDAVIHAGQWRDVIHRIGQYDIGLTQSRDNDPMVPIKRCIPLTSFQKSMFAGGFTIERSN